MFRGKRQLVVQHVMFGPDWDEACPGCTAGLDESRTRSRGTSARGRPRSRRSPGHRTPKIDAMRARRGLDVRRVLLVRQRLQLRLPRDARRLGRAGPVQLPRRGRAAGGRDGLGRRQPGRAAGCELLPARRRRGLPHLLDVRPRHRGARRHLLPARPHRARPPGGLGGAEGPGGQPRPAMPDFAERSTSSGDLRRITPCGGRTVQISA